MAGILLAPFGASFLLVGPISGHLSDRYGARYLATFGLLVSTVGFFGLTTVVSATPYLVIAAYMVTIECGSALFFSPNTNVLMSSVGPNERGAVSGIRTMLTNTDRMFAIVIGFPLALSQILTFLLYRVFLYGGGLGDAP